jgi:uncharacterized protein (TIGR00730 family)
MKIERNLMASETAGPIKTICVFGGAEEGREPSVMAAAHSLGQQIALAGVRLVYGGGSGGIMGAVAKGAAAANGHIVSITPNFLLDQIRHVEGKPQVIAVPDMHTRKRLMFDYADAFIAMPGGIGTIEEMAEVLTWRKLKQHAKPLLLANITGFWSPWLALLGHLETAGLMSGDVLRALLVSGEVGEFLPLLRGAMEEPEESHYAWFEAAIEEAGGYFSSPNP